MSLTLHVRTKLIPRDYYTDTFPGVKWPESGAEPRLNCPFHSDSSPSFYVNGDTGAFYCHGCEASGTSVLSFHARLHDISLADTAQALFSDYIHPTVPIEKVNGWHRDLARFPKGLRYLENERFFARHVINSLKIGWDGARFTFPIFNEFGLVVNVKRYLPKPSNPKIPKMASYRVDGETRPFGSPTMVYPIQALELAKQEGYVFLLEGETDTVAMLSLGIPAVTMTNGSKSWAAQYTELFRGLEVFAMQDNDDAGVKATQLAASRLNRIVSRMVSCPVPEAHGKDLTDWLLSQPSMRGNPDAILAHAEQGLEVATNDLDEIGAEVEAIQLDQLDDTRIWARSVDVEARVISKTSMPFAAPHKIRGSCSQECEGCPLAKAGLPMVEIELDVTHPSILRFYAVPEATRRLLLLQMLGMKNNDECYCKIDVVEWASLDRVVIAPTMDAETSDQSRRVAIMVSARSTKNTEYRMRGEVTPMPTTSETVFLAGTTEPLLSSIDTFDMTPELKQELRVFRSRDPWTKLHEIAEHQSKYVTRIVGRPLLHIVADLVYHSVPAFRLGDETVDKGMLDVLVIGDTRQGKGQVAEGLQRHYRLGDIVSGESCSFAGLVGGAQQVAKQWTITWGIIPHNDRRLVVVDEASSLHHDDWGKLSRVRSEGVAEITKIERDVCRARCRILWMANPRSGSEIGSYTYGVDAVTELVGQNEDVARFDLVMAVGRGQVDFDDLPTPTDTPAEAFSRAAYRDLVLWVWSRSVSDVEFTTGAYSAVQAEVPRLSRDYSPQIPLVQRENMRIKLARLSCAIAARVFSSPNGKKLVVLRSHVAAAVKLIRMLYDDPVLGYGRFSHAERVYQQPVSTEVANWLSSHPKVSSALRLIHQITAQSVSQLSGEPYDAADVIPLLSQHGLLRYDERRRFFTKTPNLTGWLNDQAPDRNRS